jgi:hypothetical protein
LLPILWQVESLTPVLDFGTPAGRIQVLLALAKAYRLCACMADSLPDLPQRIPLFEVRMRGAGVTVQLRPKTVVKRITCFASTYCEEHHTTFEAIQKAYDTAKAAAEGSSEPPVLPVFVKRPALRSDLYVVHAAPVGYNSNITTIQVQETAMNEVPHAFGGTGLQFYTFVLNVLLKSKFPTALTFTQIYVLCPYCPDP